MAGNFVQVQSVARLARRPSSAFLISLAILFALFHAVLGVTAKIGTSVTFDEIAHLTAGHVYNTLGDFRLHPENGNLPQRWAALPTRLIDPVLPQIKGNTNWERADVWRFGREFFYNGGNNTDLMIFAGRAMISIFSAATGLLVFFWAKSLFGWRAGFFSLGLFAFSPTFLAHGSLATSDAPMAFFFLASLSAWGWQLQRPHIWRAVVSGVVFGLACVAKFSAALLIPMMLGLAALHVMSKRSDRAKLGQSLRWSAFTIFLHAALALVVIWAFYDFRFSPHTSNSDALSFNHPWTAVLSGMSPTLPGALRVVRDWHLLPEAFAYGFAYVKHFSINRVAFLNGEVSSTGWIEFFPTTFLLKTTLPILLLCTLAGVIGARRLARFNERRQSIGAKLVATAPLWILFVGYWAVALSSTLNIGHRHILPTYPPLFILFGGLTVVRQRWSRLWQVALWSFLAWHAVESFRIRPHYLAYFNPLAGGPTEGYLHLVDSSLDWGQDLPRAAEWLRKHNAERRPVYIAYFGMGDPDYEGLSARRLVDRELRPAGNPWSPLEPGYYCVSATAMQQPEPFTRLGWNRTLERVYQDQRSERPKSNRQLTPEELRKGSEYATLRFSRLCNYLRARKPDATIGYSIFIYNLDATELNHAVDGSLDELIRAIEEASRPNDA